MRIFPSIPCFIGVLALVGCGDKPADTGRRGGGTMDPSLLDEDGDGYLAAEDCDDADASAFPGAEEICDGVDNDCNGATPDVFNLDGDAYTCVDDCNDNDPNINPGQAEIGCDGFDNDCDGLIDDDDSSVTGLSTFHADSDGDGYDSSTVTTALW